MICIDTKIVIDFTLDSLVAAFENAATALAVLNLLLLFSLGLSFLPLDGDFNKRININSGLYQCLWRK